MGLLLLGMLPVAPSFIPSELLSKARTQELVRASHGAVASENPLCSDIGVDILKKGGNSVDAIVATTLCIGTTNMYSSGIGGGGFMVLRTPEGEAVSIDFREEAPALAFRDMYVNNASLAQTGGLAVGIPGELRGLERAHSLYGRLEWSKLVKPSVKLARNGWRVNRILAARISSAKKLILSDPTFGSVFAPKGKLLVEGDWITRKTYATTLEAIAKDGVEVFYTGYIAQNIINTIQATGGIMTLEDLASYQPKVEPAISTTYRGRTVYGASPPTSGAVLLGILNMIESLPGFNGTDSDLNIHRMVEGFKHGYAERNYYGDPIDPVYRNITQISKRFINKEFGRSLTSTINDNKTFDPEYYNLTFQVQEDHGTMHVSVLDAEGGAAALTSTVNLLFGAKLMDPVTGIILNDEMDDFSIPGTPNYFHLAPSPYNYVYPKKRPLSSSVPTIVVKHGVVELIAGASGGSRIITSTLQCILSVLDWGMDPAAAIHQPRAHHQLYPNELNVEHEFRNDAFFTDRGHNVTRLGLGEYLTGVSMVQRLDDGSILASGDARKGGRAAGY